MSNEIGWRFPPTSGGRVDGLNDPGIAHFTGSPLVSLARETIQNSLDASLTLDTPVHVSFELITVRPESIGRDELAQAIDSSRQAAGDDSIATAALTAAADSIRLGTIPCLRVSDRDTTGLRGDQWRAIVKMQGVSQKPTMKGAGGSHGIGKYAPFAVSTLRTVFYWTCWFLTQMCARSSPRQVGHCSGKTLRMCSCPVRNGAVVGRSIDGRLRGPRSWWGACSAAA